jgi:hypothetical protein
MDDREVMVEVKVIKEINVHVSSKSLDPPNLMMKRNRTMDVMQTLEFGWLVSRYAAIEKWAEKGHIIYQW